RAAAASHAREKGTGATVLPSPRQKISRHRGPTLPPSTESFKRSEKWADHISVPACRKSSRVSPGSKCQLSGRCSHQFETGGSCRRRLSAAAVATRPAAENFLNEG